MPETLERLRAALRDRYAVERQLGSGGMAVVFLAEDLRHHRRVAIKVLRPELAASLGADRFLREIGIAASLTHPHILPLFESGEADGLLFYVMPYVEGESLADRLARERQLPVAEAVRIAQQAASALAYAHEHGVVHRDIKPENILLQSGEAVVADFGIARAISEAGGERLTTSGIVIGTPVYMSPEQAGAARALDGRTDLYSLGCVLYEMLVGHPPFQGGTAMELMARHTMDPVPSVRSARSVVTEDLERAVLRTLAKAPADRFATAAEFAQAIGTVAGTPVGPSAREGIGRGRRVLAAALAVLVLGVIAAATLVVRARSRAAPLDPRAVVIVPFRVSGEGAALAWLREGVPDLLGVKLNGEGGPRAVDMATVLRVWRKLGGSDTTDPPLQATLQLARRLGAGKVVTGTVLVIAGRLEIAAVLHDVATDRERARVDVAAPPESVTTLVERLAAELLVGEVEGRSAGLDELTSRSLAAIRAYLDGLAAYRGARYAVAIDAFQRALEHDSGFALAAMGMSLAAGWTEQQELGFQSAALAWRYRGRLSARDRTLLVAMVGPRSPEGYAGQLAAWEAAVEAIPDNAQAWDQLGETLWHNGPAFEVPAWRERAEVAFRRAVELDSAYAGALHHLVEVAAAAGDLVAVRRFLALYLAAVQGPEAQASGYVHWRAAVALGDRALQERLLFGEGVRFATLPTVLGEMVNRGLALDDLDRVAGALRTSARGPADRVSALHLLWLTALNRGRPAEARAIGLEWRASHAAAARAWERRVVMGALFGDGDTAEAAAAANTLARRTGSRPPSDAARRNEWVWDRCALALWASARGSEEAAASVLAELRAARARRDTLALVPPTRVCAALLEAGAAVRHGREDAAMLLARVDTMVLTGEWLLIPRVEDLVLAAKHAELGDTAAALAASRRRFNGNQCCIAFLSSFLRAVGRFAAAVGDTAGTIGAYEHYLALRADPEPALRAEVERVRAELERLRTAR